MKYVNKWNWSDKLTTWIELVTVRFAFAKRCQLTIDELWWMSINFSRFEVILCTLWTQSMGRDCSLASMTSNSCKCQARWNNKKSIHVKSIFKYRVLFMYAIPSSICCTQSKNKNINSLVDSVFVVVVIVFVASSVKTLFLFNHSTAHKKHRQIFQ